MPTHLPTYLPTYLPTAPAPPAPVVQMMTGGVELEEAKASIIHLQKELEAGEFPTYLRTYLLTYLPTYLPTCV